jgi:short-subunit dehydrogenase
MPTSSPLLTPPTPLRPRRRALVIGASSGIGAALARELDRDGYTLALLARRGDLLDGLCASINAKDDGVPSSGGMSAFPFVHDVSDTASVPGMLDRVISTLGGLDLVIYSAGITLHQGTDGWDSEKSRKMMEVNAIGAMAWLDPIGQMFENFKRGHIVGISSVAGDRGRIRNPAYNASKAALNTYLEALRNRLTRHGVTVLTVKPGFVDTQMIKHLEWTPFLVSPERAAIDISRAIRKKKQVIYVPARWRLAMFVIRNIPSFIFRRMNI